MNTQVRDVVTVKHELSRSKKRVIQHKEKKGVEKQKTTSMGETQPGSGSVCH